MPIAAYRIPSRLPFLPPLAIVVWVLMVARCVPPGIDTDKFRSYDSLMFCGYRHLKIDHGKRYASGKVYINGLEGFWSWPKNG